MTAFQRFVLAGALCGAALLSSQAARAQQQTPYIDRAQISGTPDDGFMVWRPYQGRQTRFYGNFALGYTLNPLRDSSVATGPENSRLRFGSDNPLAHQLNGYFSAGMQVAGRLGINFSLPVALLQDGNSLNTTINDGVGRYQVGLAALHDLRADARAMLYESGSGRCQILSNTAGCFRLGANVAMFLPTGNEFSFTSDRTTTFWLSANAEYDFGPVLLAGQIGPHFRPDLEVPPTLFLGSELRYAVGVYVPFRREPGKPDAIRLGLEAFGSTGLSSSDGAKFFNGPNTPVELSAQGRFLFGENRRIFVNAGAGARVSDGYGAPDLRVLASVGYWLGLADFNPKSPPRSYVGKPSYEKDLPDQEQDRDGDGIPDGIDKCPDVKEDGNKPNDKDGCPGPSDKDGDGIPDDVDKCPDTPEDKDGIDDADGCPEEDADNDKVPDVEDKCPKKVGPRSTDAAKNGCPQLTEVTETGEILILKKIQFETSSARIKGESYPILDEVVMVMNARPKMRVGIYGHTDDRGPDAMNLLLSKQRAAAVKTYIASKGIAAGRLESEGFGETKPITKNDTDDGRAKNRRVEFKILNQEEAAE